MTHKKMLGAASIAFFIAGFTLASWSPLVPLVKARLALSDGAMGAFLFLFGSGSIVSMPLTGYYARTMGCRKMLALSVLGTACSFVMLSLANNLLLFSVSLFLFGAFLGATDVLASINAVMVQKALDRPIMSSMHAWFSLGAFIGSWAIGLCLSAPHHVEWLLVTMMLAMVALYVYASKGINNTAEKGSALTLSLPSHSALLLGLMCWIAYLIEGSMLDWSGIFTMARTGVNVHIAGFAFTSFMAGMMLVRFSGNFIVARCGERNTFLLSVFTLLVGFALMLTVRSLPFLFTSFLLIGGGLANIAPIIFSRTSVLHANTLAASIAQVSTMGYVGVLLGPALIGGIASASSIRVSFVFVAVMAACLCVVVVKAGVFKSQREDNSLPPSKTGLV